MGLIVQSWVRNGWALWASRLAVFAIQLAIVTFVLHRTNVIGTPLGIGLFAVSGGMALLGGLFAGVGFIQLWRFGGRGGLRASLAVFVALLALAGPLAYLPTAMSLPQINDVSTDLVSPPRIIEIAGFDARDSFLASARKGPDADVQRAGYPDLRPVIVGRTIAAAFDAARAIAAREGLDIVLEEPPRKGQPIGLIQAVDETLIMGFRDDVVIRVSQLGAQARIDLRSASRYGRLDFGRNAARIRRLSRLLRARLDFALPASAQDDGDIVKNSTAKKKRTGGKKVKRARKLPPSKRVRRKKRRPAPPKIQRAPRWIVPRQG